jgi:uncharacterized damage-inducible protein DinB
MKLTDFFLAQLEREAVITRRTLERVPEGRPDWKPHAKSMPLGYLSQLVATMPGWIALTILQDELDLKPVHGGGFPQPDTSTRAALLKAFDDSVSKARHALRGEKDEHLTTTRWRLLVAGKVVAENPRHEVLADTFTHLAHHRGQLTVYLRLNDVPVPSIYGPTADDKSFG